MCRGRRILFFVQSGSRSSQTVVSGTAVLAARRCRVPTRRIGVERSGAIANGTGPLQPLSVAKVGRSCGFGNTNSPCWRTSRGESRGQSTLRIRRRSDYSSVLGEIRGIGTTEQRVFPFVGLFLKVNLNHAGGWVWRWRGAMRLRVCCSMAA